MNVSSHYYAVLAYARACGFTRGASQEIAYACQFVDDAVADLIWVDAPPPGLPLDQVDGRPCLHGMATCQDYLMLETLTLETMILNTAAFHFVPGCIGTTFEEKMVCRPGSVVALSLMREAIAVPDTVRFGMMLHVLGDTYTHQGFSGILSELNDVRIDRCTKWPEQGWPERLQRLKRWALKAFDRFVPPYGHVMADVYPDEPYASWTYRHDGGPALARGFSPKVSVENPRRFIDAFRAIAQSLQSFGEAHPGFLENKTVQVPNLAELERILLTRAGTSARIALWRRELVQHRWFEASDRALTYDPNDWLRDAFESFTPGKFTRREVRDARLAREFVHSRWYAFCRAARSHKTRFIELCRAEGLNLPV